MKFISLRTKSNACKGRLINWKIGSLSSPIKCAKLTISSNWNKGKRRSFKDTKRSSNKRSATANNSSRLFSNSTLTFRSKPNSLPRIREASKMYCRLRWLPLQRWLRLYRHAPAKSSKLILKSSNSRIYRKLQISWSRKPHRSSSS